MIDFQFFVETGLFHVLDPKAYDHILFLTVLAVIYQFKDWKSVIWLVTFFTLGHTLTLALSVYKVLSIDTKYVEFLIPLTIFITGILNIFLIKTSTGINGKVNIFLAFFFGTIHGLGFSSYFQMMIGKSENKIIPLLEFALGIEFAQIAIVLAVLLFGWIFQNIFKVSKRDWIMVISAMVAGITIPMMIDRAFW